MEAIGECAADHTAGRAVTPGLSAAALLRGRRLRSVPASASLRDRKASDGGAAAGLGEAGLGAAGLGAAGRGALDTGATYSLERCLELLDSALESAPDALALAGFPDAADFAELAEQLSRRVEYLQLLGAGAVDRTRTEAINAAGPASKAPDWTTGWGNDTGDGTGDHRLGHRHICCRR